MAEAVHPAVCCARRSGLLQRAHPQAAQPLPGIGGLLTALWRHPRISRQALFLVVLHQVCQRHAGDPAHPQAIALFNEHGVRHGEITTLASFGIDVLPFEDPDGIQLELTAPMTPPTGQG